MKVLIAGLGNMGRTYAQSFLASRFIQPSDLFVLDHKPAESLTLTKGIQASTCYQAAGAFITTCDIVVLAVKPQDFEQLATELKPFVQSEQIIFSIMAGITTRSIISLLGIGKVVRAMPNLPSQIGMGMTVFTSSPAMDKKELFIMQNLINTTGKSVYVENEEMIDAATAISGSGPAYVYYFMQAMIEKGVEMGFTPAQAELLVNQTFMGAVHLHNQSELTCHEWIKKVASKGGTTEAALRIFGQHNLQTEIAEGLQAAKERATELGK